MESMFGWAAIYFGCLWVWAEEMEISNYPHCCKTLFLDS